MKRGSKAGIQPTSKEMVMAKEAKVEPKQVEPIETEQAPESESSKARKKAAEDARIKSQVRVQPARSDTVK